MTMVGDIVLFCVTYTYTIITNPFSYRMGAGIYDYKELSHQAELYTGRWNTTGFLPSLLPTVLQFLQKLWTKCNRTYLV